MEEKIANNIRAERNRANITQEEVAKKLGISRETYSKYEKSAKSISAYQIYMLANIFECTIDAFYV